MRAGSFACALSLTSMLASACGDDAGSAATPDAGRDAAVSPAGFECAYDADCDDGVYCDGVERCENGLCIEGKAVACDDGIACTVDRCSHTTNGCLFQPMDADGDGHADAACQGPDGEALGDDCDDADADRHPGNPERCDLGDPSHDEDCDDSSFGQLDADEDGFVDARCCAGENCGADCDDANPARFPEHPEICDDIDNDCDDQVDVGTKEVPWYADADGDGYGASDADVVMSCAPVSGRSLRATDCDDAAAAIHPAAREVCDGFDNDCDSTGDEDGVCDCAPAGAKQACACDDTRTGSQVCVEGTWNACDCTECVSGVRECLGDLLPRECVDGLWVVHPACTGARPFCLNGGCVCADGSTTCQEIPDVVAPFVFGTSPVDDTGTVAFSATVSVQFSEPVKPNTVTTQSFYLRDAYGRSVPASLAVGGSSAALTPGAPLLPGMGYTAFLTTAITDLAGNALLSDLRWDFMTQPGLPVTSLTPGTDEQYDTPNLAVNASGNALLAAGSYLGVGGGGAVAAMTSVTARLGGTWLDPLMLSESYGSYDDNVAMEDDNTGFLRVGSSIFLFGGVAWATTAATTAGSAFPMALEGGGHGLIMATPGPGLLGRRLRAPDGSFGALGSTSTTGTIGLVRADVGPGGWGAIGWITDSGTVELWRSQAAMASWGRATGYAPAAGASFVAFDMAVSGTGQVVQVWADDRPTITTSQKFVAARVVGADNAQIGSDVDLLPAATGTQTEPRVEVDAAGNAIAIFRDAAAVYANRYASGSWGTAVPLSVNDSSGHNTLQLEVAANGSAIAGWMQNAWLIGDQPMELWVARYSPANGWAAARRINTVDADVTSFDLGIDATGTSLVVWKESSFLGLQTASP